MLASLRQPLTTLKYSQVAEERLETSIDIFYTALSEASPDEVRDVLADLTAALDLENLIHARRVAMVIGAHWLDRILSVFDRAPILVIEPSTQLGFMGTMTGISGNFQLQCKM